MILSGHASQNDSDVRLSGLEKHFKKESLNQKIQSPMDQQQWYSHLKVEQMHNLMLNKTKEQFDSSRRNKSGLRVRQSMVKSASMQLKLQTGSAQFNADSILDGYVKVPKTTRNNANYSENIQNCFQSKCNQESPMQQYQTLNSHQANKSQIQSVNINTQLLAKQDMSQSHHYNQHPISIEKEKSATLQPLQRYRNLSDHQQYIQKQHQEIRSKQQQYLLESQGKQDHSNLSQNNDKANTTPLIKLNTLLRKKETSLASSYQTFSEAKKNLNDFKDYITATSQLIQSNTKVNNNANNKHPLHANYKVKSKNANLIEHNSKSQIQQLQSAQKNNQNKTINGEFIINMPNKAQQNNVHQPKSIIKLSGGQFANETYLASLANNFDTKQINLQSRIKPSRSRDQYINNNNNYNININYNKNNGGLSTPSSKKEETKFEYNIDKPQENIMRKRTVSNISGVQTKEKDVQTDLPDAQFQIYHPYSNITYSKRPSLIDSSPIIRIIEAAKQSPSSYQESLSSSVPLQFSSKISSAQNNLQNFNDFFQRQIEIKSQGMEEELSQQKGISLSPAGRVKNEGVQKKYDQTLQSNSNNNEKRYSHTSSNAFKRNKFQQHEQLSSEDNEFLKNEVYLISKYIIQNVESPHYYHQISKIQSQSMLNSSKQNEYSKNSINNSINQQIASQRYPNFKLSPNEDNAKQVKITLHNNRLISSEIKEQSATCTANQKHNKQVVNQKILANQKQQSNQKQQTQQLPSKGDINELYVPKQYTNSNNNNNNKIYQSINQQQNNFFGSQSSLLNKNNQQQRDQTFESVQHLHLQNIETLQPHYQAYQTSQQYKKRAHSYHFKNNQDSPYKNYHYIPKQILKNQINQASKEYKNNFKINPTLNIQGRSQQFEESLKKQNDSCENDDFNESVQPWSRKDSELDISIF